MRQSFSSLFLIFTNLVWDGHVALLLGHTSHWSDIAHLGCGLALDDGEGGLGLNNLVEILVWENDLKVQID